MVDRLFAYGTLLAPEMLLAVIGRSAESTAAALRDYACFRVRRAAYPAIVWQKGAMTDGRVFHNLNAIEWERLDAFESDLYERCEVTVSLDDGSEISAQTYIIVEASRDRLTTEKWDLARFRQQHLQRYLNHM